MTGHTIGTDYETEKRVAITLLAAFFINAITGIILAIHGAVLFDCTTVICHGKEYLTNESL